MAPALKKTDAKARHAALCDRILAAMEAEGQERSSYRWAIRPRQHWADALGVDEKTISRLIQIPPIWTMRCQAEDPATGKRVQAVALRVGDAPERTPERVAGKMSKAFQAHMRKVCASIPPDDPLAKKLKPRLLVGDEFGWLVGLAKAWPEGHQERIFADLLKNWPGYAAAIKSDPEYDPRVKGKTVDRYLRFPSLSVIRKFQHQVPDFYLTRLQLAGKPLPFPYAKEAA